MLKIKTKEELKLNPKIVNPLKNCKFKTKNGKVKVILKTNLQLIEPTECIITHLISLTIYEYKINEISNKNFYIK